MSNYIKISRSLLDWGWYHDVNTSRLFLHMLLRANWKDGNFKGTTVPRGSFVSSVKKLSEETDLTIDETRTALEHLLKTGEVTKQSTNRFSLFCVENYDKYQTEHQASAQAEPNQVPSRTQPIPNLFPTIEEGKKERRKEGKKISTSDISAVVDAWNTLEEYGIKKITKISPTAKRFKMLGARIEEYGTEAVCGAIDNIKRSKFLQGKTAPGGGRRTTFVVTFDWFVCPNNFQKIIDGNYNDRQERVDEWEDFLSD